MRKRPKKRWGQMTPAELAEATKEFDHPLPASRYRPLTKAERARFERARRAGILDEGLLKKAQAYAKRKNMTLTQLVERGLRRELAVMD